MNRYLLRVDTNWCGEDNTYGVICSNPDDPDLMNFFQLKAYDNFNDFGGFEKLLEEMFPEVEDGEYTDSQMDEAAEFEGDHYGWTIDKFEGDEEEWEWYEIIYDESEKD